MHKRLLVLLLIVANGLFAQHSKINFQLKNAISKAKQGEMIALFVHGDVAKIKQEVLTLGGITKLSGKDVIQVEIPSSNIETFSQRPFVNSIEFSFYKGEFLNDTMIINNNVVPVHQGMMPLTQGYTGKNVILGFIDSGIDIFHPDFLDSLGNTRVLEIWDQYSPDNGSSPFGYGQIWDSASINNGICTHLDHNSVGHGTQVVGIAAGNGRAVNNYTGVAPDAYIVSVASDEYASNWLSTVVDAVKYIYDVADAYQMPCVINVSMGDYWGSHDGTDAASILIDSMVNYKPGRAFVCAAGNAGNLKWHAEQQITADTTFTWFRYNASSAFGYGAVYFEAWADTADLNNVDFAIGSNLSFGTYQFRGRTPFANIQDRLGNHTDTISNNGNRIAIVDTYGELQGDKYLLAVHLQEPDSNSYNFSLMTTGSGRLDIWAASWLGVSDMVYNSLPSSSILPQIAYYKAPDFAKTMVSSFQNLSSVLTVGNYSNRATYVDVDTITRFTGKIPGSKAVMSSWGPTRRGFMKPDIAATGDETLAANPASVIASALASTPANRAKVALGGFHRKNGGTSMASPVVAGVAALYLQKCPNATMVEIKNAIINSAKQDIYTGTVPNTGFGYGKINAFAALNYSNFSPSLGTIINLCDGDSAVLTPGVFSSYLWSNNDTSSSVMIDTTNTLYVEVTNSSGCIAMSDTINSYWRPLPPKTLLSLIGSDTLICSSNLNLQWYFNNNDIFGANDTLLVAQSNGDYFSLVTDSFGCVNYSDTLTLLTVGNHPYEMNNYVQVYPNPTAHKLTIRTIGNEPNFKLNLLDVAGKILQTSIPNGTSTLEFNLDQLSNGIYYLQLILKDKVIVEKVVLSK